MLLIVSPNLCLDRVVVVPGFAIGKVHRTESTQELASGKGVNVARAARALGVEPRVIGVVGLGHATLAILRGVAAQGIRLDAVRVRGPVRVCTLIVDPGLGETVINEPGPQVPAASVQVLRTRVRAMSKRAQMIVLAGSLPPGVPPGFYADVVRQSPVRVIVDATGEPLRRGLEARPFLVKANEFELAEAVGHPLGDPQVVRVAADDLRRATGASILVTLGAQGALLATADGSWQIVPPAVPRISTIGAGDSLTAGLAAGLLQGASLLEAARLGVAAAVADVTTLLPGTIDASLVKELTPQVGVRRIGP